VPTEVIPQLRRAIHPWRDAVSYFQIKRILRRFRPDVVHTHSAKAGILGRAAATALGVPVIVHGIHGAPFHPYQSRLARGFFRACERWAARRCHAFVSVADAMTDLMVQAGVAPREKFTTIYSGMEVEPFRDSGRHRDRVRRDLCYGPQHVVVGKVARLFRLKGHDDVIEAARDVIQNQENVRFLFVGDGILWKPLQAAIAALGLEKYFHFAGLVPPNRVAEMISAMDIVVHASLREGLARVLPQALIAGKPAISYDVDGAREVVLPEVTGLLVPPRDIRALGKAISRLASDAALCQRMGRAGQGRFTEIFCHQRMAASLHELYRRLLAERKT